MKDNWNQIVQYQRLNRDNNNIKDISYGSILMNLDQQNPFNLKLSLLLNTNGVQVGKSCKKSLWPILFICNFLPPKIRFNQRNIVLSALYLGETKPEMLDFFAPICNEFNDINENGIEVQINNETIKLKVHITQCSLQINNKTLQIYLHIKNRYFISSYI